MEKINIISAENFCARYDVPVSFIEAISDFDFIDTVFENEHLHIRNDQINLIEKLMRFHFDLNVNMEGIDVIMNLLEKINSMESEIRDLKKQLNIYR